MLYFEQLSKKIYGEKIIATRRDSEPDFVDGIIVFEKDDKGNQKSAVQISWYNIVANEPPTPRIDLFSDSIYIVYSKEFIEAMNILKFKSSLRFTLEECSEALTACGIVNALVPSVPKSADINVRIKKLLNANGYSACIKTRFENGFFVIRNIGATEEDGPGDIPLGQIFNTLVHISNPIVPELALLSHKVTLGFESTFVEIEGKLVGTWTYFIPVSDEDENAAYEKIAAAFKKLNIMKSFTPEYETYCKKTFNIKIEVAPIIEFCSFCETENYINEKDGFISVCQNCGKLLIACSGCKEECNWSQSVGCHHCTAEMFLKFIAERFGGTFDNNNVTFVKADKDTLTIKYLPSISRFEVKSPQINILGNEVSEIFDVISSYLEQ